MMLLKEIRMSRGISQEELERRSGISRVTISMLETGKQKNVTIKTLTSLALALGVTVSDFFLENRKVH